MPVNVWSAGQDALLGFLAERDATRRLNEDRARRDRLDQEAFSDRQRQRGIQEQQLTDLAEDRKERRAETTRLNNEKIAASEAKRKQDETSSALVKEMLDPATPPERKQAIGFELDRLGVSPTLVDKYLNPKKDTKPIVRINPRTGKVETLGEAPANAHFVQEPRPPAGPAGAKPVKDDPRLPMGTKRWIESISQRGVQLPEARTELSKGWSQQIGAHPNADLGAAAEYLMKLYPTAPDPMAASPRAPLGNASDGPPSTAAAAPVAPTQATGNQDTEIQQTAHAIISEKLNANATPEQVAKFLSDPQNVEQIKRMLAGGR